MKKSALLIAFAAAIALSATQSFAQAQNFEGFSAGLDYNSTQLNPIQHISLKLASWEEKQLVAAVQASLAPCKLNMRLH